MGFISCLSFFVFSTSTFAETPNNDEKILSKIQNKSEEQLNNKLRKLGYPDDYISIMSIDQKQDIIASNPVKFEGVSTKEFYYDNDGKLQEKKSGEINALGTISTTDLTLTLGKALLGTFNGKKTYRIETNWKWNKGVFWTFEDKIAIAYNDKFQERVSNSGNYVCKSFFTAINTGAQTSTNCGGRPSDITMAGAEWIYDIQSGYDFRNTGWVKMEIETVNPNTTGIGKFRTKYYHKTSLLGLIRLDIKFFSTEVSSGSGYDEAANSTSWNY